MKRPLAFLLSLSLLLSPALAAEPDIAALFPEQGRPPAFQDVAEGDWFAPYAEICAATGLMTGTGADAFSPGGQVTRAEALTLAARIHHILNGGDGNLPAAPEDWGCITLTATDGSSRSGYGDDFQWLALSRVDITGHPALPLDTEELLAWGAALDGQPGTLSTGGCQYPGTFRLSRQPDGETLLYLEYSGAPDTTAIFHARIHPGAGTWYRDAAYYLEANEIIDPIRLRPNDDIATRSEMLTALDAVCGSLLTPINQIEDYPDWTEQPSDTVLRFYNAGILTGIDAYGSFGGNLGLTRAEMAAMAARLVRPELRISFTPEQYPQQSYTLTPVDLQGWEPDPYTPQASSDYLFLHHTDDEGNQVDSAVLRAAGGSIYVPPEDTWLTAPGPDGLAQLSRSDPTIPSGSAYAVADVDTGELVLPFGRWDELWLVGNGYFLTRVNSLDPAEPMALRDKTGAQVAAVYSNQSWQMYVDGLGPCQDRETGLWGYADADGRWILSPQWTSAMGFVDGYAVVGTSNGLGTIDRAGNTIIPCQYDTLTYQGSGLFHGFSFATGSGCWLRADGTPLRNSYASWEGPVYNGYFAHNGRYLDINFLPVTGRDFDWTGPVSETGAAFVGIGGTTYRLQFEAGA